MRTERALPEALDRAKPVAKGRALTGQGKGRLHKILKVTEMPGDNRCQPC